MQKRAIVALVAALLAFGYLFTLNPIAVDFRFLPGGARIKVSFALALFLFFLAGFAVAVFFSAFREGLRSFAFWRHQRADARRDEAHRLLAEGRGSVVLGKTKVAHKLLRRAARKGPGDLTIALEVARLEVSDGRLADAERRLKVLAEDHPKDPQVLALLLELYRAREDFEGQVATLRRWLEGDPEHPGALASLRDLYRRASNWADAVRIQEKIVPLASGRPARTEARRLLAELRYREARRLPPPDAKAVLERLLRDEEGFAPAHLALGEALWAAGDHHGAGQAWLRGYEATEQVGLLLRLEAARLAEGGAEEVLKLYKKLGKRGGAPVLLRARLLLELERATEALDLLEGDGAKEASSPLGRLLLGEALYRLRSFQGAAEAFRRSALGGAIDVTPGFVCRHCRARHRGWAEGCPACGALGTLDLDLDAAPPALSEG